MSEHAHDQWHTHSPDATQPMKEHGAQASPKVLGLTFIAMTLGVLFVIIVLKVYFDSYMSSYRSKIDENTKAAAVTWNHKQDVLGTLAPQIPQAIDAVVREYAQN